MRSNLPSAVIAAFLAIASALAIAPAARAVPAFAVQTGQPCNHAM